jgi:hypothetical protein
MKHLTFFLSSIALLLFFGCSASPEKAAETLGTAEKIAIQANLKNVSVAGRTVLLENGKSQVTFKELKSAGMVNSVRSIKGENYDNLEVKNTGGTLTVTTRTGDKITESY